MSDGLIRCRCGAPLSWERMTTGLRHADGIRCERCVHERILRNAAEMLDLTDEAKDAFVESSLAMAFDARER